MEITLYAFQIIPGSDEELHFAETLEECRSAAIEQREEMKSDEDYADMGAMAIYECVISIGDMPTLVDILNDPTDIVDRLLVSKKLVAVAID
jgi:hypothetical protein